MGRVARIRLIPGLPGRARAWRYGPHRSQRAELLLPQGAGPHRVMVVIHGGGWRDRATMSQTGALAEDLTRRGWATWNIEYRRVGEGGGWPATFEDVAGAIDRLAGLDAPLDLDAVSVLGHSAGGHLALWAAGRERLPAGSPGASPVVPLRRAIGMAAVCDLAGAYRRWRGGAVEGLMGGAPEQLKSMGPSIFVANIFAIVNFAVSPAATVAEDGEGSETLRSTTPSTKGGSSTLL